MNNNSLSDILMQLHGKCPNCDTVLTFKESALLAKENGIEEDAIMCYNCNKVYTVELTLENMLLKDEVSTNFTQVNNNTIKSNEITLKNEDKPLNKIKKQNETKDNASLFKDFYLKGKYDDAINLNKSWIKQYPEDANVYYAGIIMALYDNSVPYKEMEFIKNVADRKQAINTNLNQWFKTTSENALLNQKKSEENKIENIIQNNSLNNQNTMNNIYAINTENKLKQENITDNEDNSFFALLFYKKDKITNQYRISKTKTISILLFLLLFIFTFIIAITDIAYNPYADEILIMIIICFIISLLFTIPVFIIGYITSYILDKYKVNKSNSYNTQPNINTDYHYNNQQNNMNNNSQYNIAENNINTPISGNVDRKHSQTSEIVYYEKDNLGTRHDTIEKASAYWLGERLQMEIKPPFTLYNFQTAQKAEEALLELPYIHKASDTGNLICNKVFQFGYYKVNENNYEAIICGKDLTYEEFQLAEESFKKHDGKLKNNLEPEKITEKITKKIKTNGVRYRETIRENQFTYECYDADTREEAQEFLKNKPVTQRLYYICVYTPEGNYGRDINGIYQM